jgi:hypothetical protein
LNLSRLAAQALRQHLISDGGTIGNQSRLRSSAGSTAVYVTSGSLVRRRGQCGLDVSHHHALHRSILVNIEMTDMRHMPGQHFAATHFPLVKLILDQMPAYQVTMPLDTPWA